MPRLAACFLSNPVGGFVTDHLLSAAEAKHQISDPLTDHLRPLSSRICNFLDGSKPLRRF